MRDDASNARTINACKIKTRETLPTPRQCPPPLACLQQHLKLSHSPSPQPTPSSCDPVNEGVLPLHALHSLIRVEGLALFQRDLATSFLPRIASRPVNLFRCEAFVQLQHERLRGSPVFVGNPEGDFTGGWVMYLFAVAARVVPVLFRIPHLGILVDEVEAVVLLVGFVSVVHDLVRVVRAVRVVFKFAAGVAASLATSLILILGFILNRTEEAVHFVKVIVYDNLLGLLSLLFDGLGLDQSAFKYPG